MERYETSPRLIHQPALDGLRGLALLGVVAYHAGIDGLSGGFLGVSTFFTLSGFLITSLLLVEHRNSGRIELTSFWARRLRRLLPASLVTITAIVVGAAVLADDSQLARLRPDALASLFNFSNWRFIAEGESYGALFQSPSLFRHFWSLSVEEQYYLAFPVAVAIALGAFGGPTRRFEATLGAVSVAAMAWPAILAADGATSDRLYYGTDTRLGELLVGAMLALWWVRRGQRTPDAPVPTTAAALIAAGVMGWMWTVAHPDDHFLYHGGLAFHAVLTLVVIVAAITPRGPVRWILSTRPLRRLGAISYGAYLIHWPVLLGLQQETSLGPGARFAVGLVITVGLAGLSHRLVEQPIRQWPTVVARRRAPLAVPAAATVALLVLTVTTWRVPGARQIDFAAARTEVAELTAVAGQPDGTGQVAPIATSEATPDPVMTVTARPAELQRPLRLTGFGDSTALMTGLGIARWAEDHPDELTVVPGHAQLGCGLVTGAVRRVEGREGQVSSECDTWLTDWVDAIRDQNVDMALVQLGAWEIFDHQIEPGGPFLAIGRDPGYDALLLERLETAVDTLHQHSDVVAIISNPDVGSARLERVPAGANYPELDPARSARWRELVTAVAADRPDTIVIDLAGWIDRQGDDDRRLRPDGVHFSETTTEEVARWLVPELLDRYRAIREDRDVTRTTALTALSPPAIERASPTRVLLVGDSLMADTAPAALAALESAAEPIEARFELFPALPRTGDEVARWRDLISSFGPDVVVMYIGFWETAAASLFEPAPGEPGFDSYYRDSVLAPWFDDLGDLGVETIFLGMAPVRPHDTSAGIQLTVMAAEAEAAGRDLVDFVPTGPALAPDGYVDILPDPTSGIDERVRRTDGLHLCPDGAERVVDLMVERLQRLMSISPDDDWRVGPWRQESWIDNLAAECPPVD